MVNKKLGVKSAKELNGATVCVAPGTTTELNLADYFRANKMTFKPVVIEKVEEIRAAFFSGRCDVYTTDVSSLCRDARRQRAAAGQARGLHHPAGDHLQGAARPDGAPRRQPVRRHRALDAVRDARGRGVRHHLEERRRDAEERESRRSSASSASRRAWARRWASTRSGSTTSSSRSVTTARASTGNVGPGSLLKIDRGVNKLWTQGGLQYAPPIR